MRFLTARWESLVLLNYPCPAAFLAPLVPAGTVLDEWNGQTLVSLVGFLFADTRILGVPVPGYRNFEEVNLRFYVCRHLPDGSFRRAVVFIRELVPRRAIAAVARVLYNEPYVAVPMAHHVSLEPASGGVAEYSWRHQGAAFLVRASATGRARPLDADSEAEFITEHYWGYTRQRDGRTREYQVEHPRWDIWDAADTAFEGPAAELYGGDFGRVLAATPQSAFVAIGSPVIVHTGQELIER